MLDTLFDQIRIINLAHRDDRRRQVAEELTRIGLTVDGEKIRFHTATRPTDAGGFPTLGAHGCFLSHLSVLRDARDSGAKQLLVLEDDMAFTDEFVTCPTPLLEAIDNANWDLLWLGGPNDRMDVDSTLLLQETRAGIIEAHCFGVRASAFDLIISELEAMLQRPPGSPDGGPMHVDGAYSTIVANHHTISRYVSTQTVAYQRSSRSDIAELKWWDRMPVVRSAASWYRKTWKQRPRSVR